MAAAPTLRSISMADCSLTLFPTKTPHPFLSIPSKSIKPLHLSYSPSAPLLSTNRRLPTTPLVAQTLEWAQQGEGAAAEVEELGWSSEEKQDGEVAEESFPEPPEEAKLFVGNLSFNVDSEKLAQLFEQAGVVEVAEVIYNRETDKSRGFGFVTMSTVEEAEKAVEIFNGYDIDGRLLTVNRAAPRGTRPERSQESQPSSKIYVGNLPWQVDDARLGQVFSEHGKVVDARVVCDQETGRSRGFGFVTMASVTEVDDAIAALDGLNLDGRSLRVNVAEQKPRRVAY